MNKLQSLQPAGAVCLTELRLKPQLVKHILQEHEEGYEKIQHLGARKLGTGLKICLWGLRLYVVFMVVVVAVNVSQAIH